MAEDDLDRLNKLAELRDRGVLSEAEFRNAKARLLRGSSRQAPRDETAFPDRQPFWKAHWPALAGVALLLLLIGGVILYGKLASDEESVEAELSISNDMSANLLDATPSGEALCASQAIYMQIKELIFNQAAGAAGVNPAPLNSLRGTVGVRMQYPLLRGGSQDVGRTDCSGRIILDLPPTVRRAFDNASTLEADIDYAIQPGADGSGNVVQLGGIDFVVQQLAAAAALAGTQQADADSAQSQKVLKPSFNCGENLSNVERMICQDADLSRLDRALAARYATLKKQLPATEWQSVVYSQRDFLQRRGGCADSTCVRDAYGDQLRDLGQFEVDGANAG